MLQDNVMHSLVIDLAVALGAIFVVATHAAKQQSRPAKIWSERCRKVAGEERRKVVQDSLR